MKTVLKCLTVAGMLCASVGAVLAEGDTPQKPWERIRLRFQELVYADQFRVADTNRDSFLTPDEARAAGLKWNCFSDSARWQAADANGDGKLSLDEALAEKRTEADACRQELYRYGEWLKQAMSQPNIDSSARTQLRRVAGAIQSGALTLEMAQTLLASEKTIQDLEAAMTADTALTAEQRQQLQSALTAQCRVIFALKHETAATADAGAAQPGSAAASSNTANTADTGRTVAKEQPATTKVTTPPVAVPPAPVPPDVKPVPPVEPHPVITKPVARPMPPIFKKPR
jgi:hypothetical protein